MNEKELTIRIAVFLLGSVGIEPTGEAEESKPMALGRDRRRIGARNPDTHHHSAACRRKPQVPLSELPR
jgi:hypothetical protein